MKNTTIKKYVIDNFTPRKTQRTRIKKLYGELQDFFGEQNCFQTGSYARFTAIRPVNDLDIFYVFGNDVTTAAVVDRLPGLAKQIEDEFSAVCSENFSVEVQNASIKLQFEDDFSIDVVPAIDTGKTTSDLSTPIYIVQNRKTMDWKFSDPKGYKEITKETDELSDKNFRRVVRFVKAWRKGCKDRDDDFKLKSFHIEQILIETFNDNNGIELYDAIKSFYTEVPNNLLGARFEDRAYVGKEEKVYIDEYVNELTPIERNQIVEWSAAQLEKILGMESSEDESAIVAIIEDVMTCSGDSSKTATSASESSFKPSGQHKS